LVHEGWESGRNMVKGKSSLLDDHPAYEGDHKNVDKHLHGGGWEKEKKSKMKVLERWRV